MKFLTRDHGSFLEMTVTNNLLLKPTGKRIDPANLTNLGTELMVNDLPDLRMTINESYLTQMEKQGVDYIHISETMVSVEDGQSQKYIRALTAYRHKYT